MTVYRILKPLVSVALFSLLLTLSRSALAIDSFIVVKLTDMDKKVEHRIVSAEELKALETEIKAEASLFAKAEELAKKDWKADEGNKSTPFPPGLNPRKVEVVERFTVREKADAKLEKLDDAESRRQIEPKKTGKVSDTDKKRAEAKAEREDALKSGQELVKAKLKELATKEPAKDEKAGEAGKDEKPADKKL
jgi:hypothetical protein